jgi:hypothetical protein
MAAIVAWLLSFGTAIGIGWNLHWLTQLFSHNRANPSVLHSNPALATWGLLVFLLLMYFVSSFREQVKKWFVVPFLRWLNEAAREARGEPPLPPTVPPVA